MKREITNEMKQLLRNTVDSNPAVSLPAKQHLAAAIADSVPLNKGVLRGDNLAGIFSMDVFDPGIQIEYPLDFISPGNEDDFVAYTLPNTGRIPEFHIEGDFVTINTFDVGASIDWSRKYARDARWDIVSRAMQALEAVLMIKRNDDGWHVLQQAAVDRGLIVTDTAATAGLFTKRLVSLGKTLLRRNAGGNASSMGQGRLTHIAISPESLEDIRSWDISQVDDVTRREIFLAGEGEMSLTKIFGVTLIDLDELGVGQRYEDYITNTAGGTHTNSKVEWAIGLDLMNRDSFIMPYRNQPNGKLVEVNEDVTLLRQNRAGYFTRTEYGVGCLDNRRVILLQL